jgi:hypothetical protein
MFIEKTGAKCAVVKRVTDSETILCNRPARVVIAWLPEPTVLCLDCANELSRELESDLDANWIHEPV